MATLKCKMCGGELSFEEGMTVCECEYCGSKQTITAIDDEKILKLYDRANRFRMANEFDKAANVYESIIAEHDSEADAYWGLLLCKYGIEYVDDPATGDKIPTCHRVSFESIMEDADFENVMDNSDSLSRAVYRDQAKQIEEIRKGIIEVSGKEQPYDIFICYKETNENGDRTVDSVMAQDVYEVLTDKGYRVFFSRITLEDKLGTEYEPYIFAALNSAKVMLVFGTSYDYYNAVWVKNEWSRYISLMAKDKEKHLIPCYKDIDAYDIPKEFKHLQAQDMGKVGAVQDLTRGIDKIFGRGLSENSQKQNTQPVIQQVVQKVSGANAQALLQRGFMALEDRDWKKADEFFENVLNEEPQNVEAYLGKLLAEYRVSKKEGLSDLSEKFDKSKNYEKILRFGSDELKSELDDYLKIIQMGITYRGACENIKKEKYQEAITTFRSILDYKDAKEKIKECEELDRKAKEAEKKVDEMVAAITTYRISTKEKIANVEEEIKYMEEWIKRNEESMRENIQKVKNESPNLEKKETRRGEENRLRSEIKNANEKTEALSKELNELGIFSIKRKKKIETEIDSLKSMVEQQEHEIDVILHVDELMKDINESKEGIGKAKKDIEDYKKINEKLKRELENKKDKITYKQAIDLLKDDTLQNLFKAKYPILFLQTYIREKMGNIVKFGRIKGEYKDIDIEWRVFELSDYRCLLVAEKGYDFNAEWNHIFDCQWEPWGNSKLRRVLNGEFIEKTFLPEEQAIIEESCVSFTKYSRTDLYANRAGCVGNTVDKVFILSKEEALKYFKNDSLRILKSNSLRRDGTTSSLAWGLRTEGEGKRAAVVQCDGKIDDKGGNAYNAVVRPALWIYIHPGEEWYPWDEEDDE